MKPLIYGHRGSPFKAPENTIASIKKALEDGCEAVEIDVRKTKDNKIVVIHDIRVDRTANGKGFVSDFALNELKKLSFNGEKIPTLNEVIDFVDARKSKIFGTNSVGKKAVIIIELKEENLEKDIIKIIEKNGFLDKAIIISFYHKLIKNIKESNKKIKTGILLVGKPIDTVELAQEAEADYLFLNYAFVDKELVSKAHKNNLKVYVWNIDAIKDLEEMLKLNVDGIGSNKPELIVGYFKK